MLIIPRLQRAGRSLTFPTVVQRASGGTGASTAAPSDSACCKPGLPFNVVSFNPQKANALFFLPPGALIATSAATQR